MPEFLVKNGKVLAIIRPDNPELALKMVADIPNGTPHEEAERRFNEVLEAQPYRFMGLACKDQPRYFLSEAGKIIGQVQPGDSFVDYEAIEGAYYVDPAKRSRSRSDLR